MTTLYAEMIGETLHRVDLNEDPRSPIGWICRPRCTCGWVGMPAGAPEEGQEEALAHRHRARQRYAQQVRVEQNDEANRLWASLMDDERLADMIDLSLLPGEARSFSTSERRALIGEAARRLRLLARAE